VVVPKPAPIVAPVVVPKPGPKFGEIIVPKFGQIVAPKPAPVVAPKPAPKNKTVKTCPEGKILNEKTNRCIKIKNKTVKK
jgi:hypothetical protein